MINKSIDKLVSYGLLTGMIEENDAVYVRNRILTRLGLDSYEATNEKCVEICELSGILKDITDFAVEKGIIEDSITFRDIFDTEIRRRIKMRGVPSYFGASFFVNKQKKNL